MWPTKCITKFDKFTNNKFDGRIKERKSTVFIISLCFKPVKFIKVFPHVVKLILVKLLEMLRYVSMSIIIQWISKIHRSTLNIILISLLIGQFWLMLQKSMFQQKFLEAYYILLEKSTLDEQLEPDRLNLFRNSLMWLYYSVNILTPREFKF